MTSAEIQVPRISRARLGTQGSMSFVLRARIGINGGLS